MRWILAASLMIACSPATRTPGSGGGVQEGNEAGGDGLGGGGAAGQGDGGDQGDPNEPKPGGEGGGVGGGEGGGQGDQGGQVGDDPPPFPDPAPDPTPDPQADPDPDPTPDPEPDADPFGSWIGGPCRNAADCDYAPSECIDSDDGFPDGTCTQDCERFCPDQDGEPVTYCIGLDGIGGGTCVSKCDRVVYPGDGCRDGYDCVTAQRFEEPASRAGVCLPEDDGGDDPTGPGPGPAPDGECIEAALRLGLDIRGTDERRGNPSGRPDIECRQPEPIFLSSPVNGVNWRYFSAAGPRDIYMACRLSLALHALGELLTEHEIDAAEHLGVFNCRLIGGSNDLSEHGWARAIDLSAFTYNDGTRCVVEDDWFGLEGEPDTLCGQLLQDLAWEMFNRQIFNIVLTPDFNAAHFNHFHVDLTPDAHFLG